MNKFKVFFTFLAFIWLLTCGIGAIYAFVHDLEGTRRVAWIGLLINAWALPFWMLLRYLFAGKIEGDLREAGAFAAVLSGLAIVLLTDNNLGLPIYLAIYNLFVFLIYLYHLSAVTFPEMPSLDTPFPTLAQKNAGEWSATAYCRKYQLSGVLVLFLRGSYCADSRNQLIQLQELVPELQRRKVGLVLWSTEPEKKWPIHLNGGFGASQCPDSNGDAGPVVSRQAEKQVEQQAERVLERSTTSDVGKPSARLTVQQLTESLQHRFPFIARGGAPLLLRPWVRDAARPSAWLVDAEGYILWRELAPNYRTPPSAATLRAQLFRLLE